MQKDIEEIVRAIYFIEQVETVIAIYVIEQVQLTLIMLHSLKPILM